MALNYNKGFLSREEGIYTVKQLVRKCKACKNDNDFFCVEHSLDFNIVDMRFENEN